MNKKKKLSLYEKFFFIILAIRDLLSLLISLDYRIFTGIMRYANPLYLNIISAASARRAYSRAIKNVPAYKAFIDFRNTNDIPEMDKENYIKAYSIDKRCVGGKIPSNKVMIDESSGSTGTPFNWIRTQAERRKSLGSISYFSRYCFNNNFDIVINAFSMGSWATGINMGRALEHNAIVKNTGPDLEKIIKTMQFFGPQYKYLILGYPPFLKQVVDTAENYGFPLQTFNLRALVGGEGMSEGLRDYLLQHFQQVYSGYGASDIEIGLAGETPLSVAIRRLARENDAVKKAIFGTDSRLPMVFQYNPLEHHIEVNENGELLFTINRGSVLSPRIRYNIHDQGGIADFHQMQKYLRNLNIDIKALDCESTFWLRLPFLWVFGRKDFTISIMGANIYPEDIEQCVYADKQLSEITRSFFQSVVEKEGNKIRPAFYFEISVDPSKDLEFKFQTSIIENLKKINLDFREAWKEYSDTLLPEIHLYKIGDGPFKMVPGQIKQRRMLKPQ